MCATLVPVSTYAADVSPDLYDWDLVDPARLLRDLAARSPLVAGRTFLVQVVEPATRQVVTAHTVLWDGASPDDPDRARADAVEAMRHLGHREWRWDDNLRLRSAVVTVVAREGRAVHRDSDYDTYRALRYANNEFQALTGDIVIVTPYGWIIEPDGVARRVPAVTVVDMDAAQPHSFGRVGAQRYGPCVAVGGSAVVDAPPAAR